ncbi:MAG: hypothetical protein V1789_02485 [PVC group bacterium]
MAPRNDCLHVMLLYFMLPVVTIRRVPVDLYFALKKWAKMNHRSMQEQVKCILEREVELVWKKPALKTRDWRDRLQDRDWGDITGDIRRERNR